MLSPKWYAPKNLLLLDTFEELHIQDNCVQVAEYAGGVLCCMQVLAVADVLPCAAPGAAQQGAGNHASPGESRSPHLGASDMTPETAAVDWGPAAPDPGTIPAGCCLACCQPVTGRTHQIRVHMAAAGLPLIGDELYGLQVGGS